MSGLSLSLGLGLTSLRPSGGTPTPTPAPVITFDGTTFANTLGNAGQWQADGSDIVGQSGATMAYVEASMAGRAIQQSVGGVLSKVVIVEAAGPPITIDEFNGVNNSLLTAPANGSWLAEGGTQPADAARGTVLAGQAKITSFNASGSPPSFHVFVKDAGSTSHFVETTVDTANGSVIFKYLDPRHYLVFRHNDWGTNDIIIGSYIDGVETGQIAGTSGGFRVPGIDTNGADIRIEVTDTHFKFFARVGAETDYTQYLVKAGQNNSLPGTTAYAIPAGLTGASKVGMRSGTYNNLRFGSISRPINLSVASQARSPDDPNKTRVVLGGAYGGGVTAIEFYVALADGTPVQTWTAGQALSGGTLVGQYVDIPLTLGEQFVIVGRDPSNPATAATVSATAPVLQSVAPYTHGINESFVADSTPMSRERNLFARGSFRTPELGTRPGESWGYLEDFDFAETGFDETGQYYSWPAGVTYALLGLGRGMKAGQYDIDCSGMTGSVEVGQSQNVNVISPFSNGVARIEITQDYNYAFTLRISNTAPIATGGLGPATVTCFKVGETDKVSYLSDPFKAHMAAGRYRAYRNMTADLSAPFTGLVNRGSNVVGMLCPKAWGEISYLNGSNDLQICIPHFADEAWITAYATALRDEGNINPASFILPENSNEVWNSSSAYIPQYNWHMYEGTKRGYYVSSGAPVPIPALIDGLANDYVNPGTGALKIALAAGDTIIWSRWGSGQIVMKTAITRNIGDIVPAVTGSNWTLVVNNSGTGLAQRLMYSERSAMIFDKFDAVFGSAKIKPVVAWQHAAGFTSMADILGWNDLYLKMVGRGITMTGPYWGHSFGDRTYNGYPGWTATERALLTTDPAAFKTKFFTAATGVINATVDSDVLFKQQMAQWLVDRDQSPNALRKGSYEINWHATFDVPWPVEMKAVFAEIVRDSRMGDLVTLQATRTRNEVGGYQMYFHRGDKIPTDFLLQYWGMTENEYDIGPTNFRFTALAAVGAGA